MPIFEYQCNDCLAVFEHLCVATGGLEISCISCQSRDVSRVECMLFSPNKNFCPKSKTRSGKRDIRSSLIDLFGMNESQCYSGCSKKILKP